jgi:hypothetical protein
MKLKLVLFFLMASVAMATNQTQLTLLTPTDPANLMVTRTNDENLRVTCDAIYDNAGIPLSTNLNFYSKGVQNFGNFYGIRPTVNGTNIMLAGEGGSGDVVAGSVNRFTDTNSFDAATYLKDLYLYGTNIYSLLVGGGGGASEAITNAIVGLQSTQATVVAQSTAISNLAAAAQITGLYASNTVGTLQTSNDLAFLWIGNNSNNIIATTNSMGFTNAVRAAQTGGGGASEASTNWFQDATHLTNLVAAGIVTNGQISASLGQLINNDGTNTAGNAYAEKDWVRSLFTGGTLLYASTNINPVNTSNFCYIASTQAIGNVRTYTNVTAGLYIGTVMTTSRYTEVQSPITVNAYLGKGAGSANVAAEIYYSYDGTNYLGDYAAGGQDISTTNELHTYVISFPTIVSTNSEGFYIVRRLKVISQASTPNISMFIGGPNASHITLTSPVTDPSLGIRGATNAVGGAATSYDTVTRTQTIGPDIIAAANGLTNGGTYSALTVTNLTAAGNLNMGGNSVTNANQLLVTNPAVIVFAETADDNVGIESVTFPIGNSQTQSTWMGYAALNQSPGSFNNAQGYAALYQSPGSYNSAQGYAALYQSPGNFNSAQGFQALYLSPGSYNSAQGFQALRQSPGSFNSAQGGSALNQSPGSFNSAQGFQAGQRAGGATNLFLGANAGYSGLTTTNYYTNCIVIGGNVGAKGSGTIALGLPSHTTYVDGSMVVSNGVTVAGGNVNGGGNQATNFIFVGDGWGLSNLNISAYTVDSTARTAASNAQATAAYASNAIALAPIRITDARFFLAGLNQAAQSIRAKFSISQSTNNSCTDLVFLYTNQLYYSVTSTVAGAADAYTNVVGDASGFIINDMYTKPDASQLTWQTCSNGVGTVVSWNCSNMVTTAIGTTISRVNRLRVPDYYDATGSSNIYCNLAFLTGYTNTVGISLTYWSRTNFFTYTNNIVVSNSASFVIPYVR